MSNRSGCPFRSAWKKTNVKQIWQAKLTKALLDTAYSPTTDTPPLAPQLAVALSDLLGLPRHLALACDIFNPGRIAATTTAPIEGTTQTHRTHTLTQGTHTQHTHPHTAHTKHTHIIHIHSQHIHWMYFCWQAKWVGSCRQTTRLYPVNWRLRKSIKEID